MCLSEGACGASFGAPEEHGGLDDSNAQQGAALTELEAWQVNQRNGKPFQDTEQAGSSTQPALRCFSQVLEEFQLAYDKFGRWGGSDGPDSGQTAIA